jgi:hypothetical protein
MPELVTVLSLGVIVLIMDAILMTEQSGVMGVLRRVSLFLSLFDEL